VLPLAEEAGPGPGMPHRHWTASQGGDWPAAPLNPNGRRHPTDRAAPGQRVKSMADVSTVARLFGSPGHAQTRPATGPGAGWPASLLPK
jgi:hypothetical protein